MTSGALVQLKHKGSEDVYLTGNPSITFFKHAFQQYTNFASEWIHECFESSKPLQTTSRIRKQIKIRRHGDLLSDVALVFDLPNIYSTPEENFKWIDNIGHSLIKSTEFVIGGQVISKLYGQWMNIWYELITPESKRKGFNTLIGNIEELTNPTRYHGDIDEAKYPTINKKRLRIPLPFWFTEHPGLALPLVAIQYTDVYIYFDFLALNDLFTIGKPSVNPKELFENPDKSLTSNHEYLRKELASARGTGYTYENIFWKFVSGFSTQGIWSQNMYMDCKYIFLDDREQKIFAGAKSEYLLTQVERIDRHGLHGTFQEDIEFFHPVKEMIWVFQRSDIGIRNQWTNYSKFLHNEDYFTYKKIINDYSILENFGLSPTNILQYILPSGMNIVEFENILYNSDEEKLQLTNSDAFNNYGNIMYYGEFMFNTHSRQIAKTDIFYRTEPYRTHTNYPSSSIYSYSFSLDPEKFQPTGTANFSQYSKSQFRATLQETKSPEEDSNEEKLTYSMFFYVRNMNILRIQGGLASLVFAN